MKLLNINEEIPEYFYIFLDFNDSFGFMHWNNFNLSKKIYSGAIINSELNLEFKNNYLIGKQKYLPYIPSEEAPLSRTSFSLNIVNNYTLEYNLELYRYSNVCKYPSRLSAVYAFGNYETCIQVSKKYNWDLNTVKKFKLVNSEEIRNLCRVTKNNMEIISYMRGLDCRFFSREDQNRIYEHYWEGKGNLRLVKNNKEYNTGIIYEYLIEGILELVEENWRIC